MTRPTPSRFRLRDGVSRRKLERETLVVDPNGGEHGPLSADGELAWSSLGEGASFDELVEELAASEAVPAEQAEAKVEALLLWLSERNLVERPR